MSDLKKKDVNKDHVLNKAGNVIKRNDQHCTIRNKMFLEGIQALKKYHGGLK
jgi:hypothetical protein